MVRKAAYDFVRERVNSVVLTPSPAAEPEPPTKRCKVENDGLGFLLGETDSSTSETHSEFERYLVAANTMEDARPHYSGGGATTRRFLRRLL